MGTVSTAILRGEEDVSLWSEEELIRGQKKGINGGWVGRKPSVVPKAVHDELVKRKLSKSYELLRDNLVSAVQVLVEIANDKEASHSDRLKAATLIMERVMGKPTENVNLAVQAIEAPWQKALNLAIVGSLEQAATRNATDGEIVDAEIVDPNEEIIDPWDDLLDEEAPVGQPPSVAVQIIDRHNSWEDQRGRRPTGNLSDY